MLSLHSHHIVDLYVWVDDLIVKSPKNLSRGGRPPLLSESETITILVWNALLLHQKTLKDIHRFMRAYLRKEFPKMPKLVNEHTKIGIGDSHYGARVMGRILWEKYGTIFIAPPHYKQKRKIATPFQNKLLSDRSKIESVFDIMKEHLHLVSSFPRSVFGYLVHYVRILLGYQIIALFG